MALIAELIREIPALAPHRDLLESLAHENERLKAENADLKKELGEYISQWETLDGDAVTTLRHVAAADFESAEAIARTHHMNGQIAELYLRFLVTHAYVAEPPIGGSAAYGLTHKGRRYLRERGFIE
jgi:regulator of replication initiation timing